MLNLPSNASPLAVAALGLSLFGCFCAPAMVAALVCGIIALVQISKDPSIEGRTYAIIGVVLPAIYLPIVGTIFFFVIKAGSVETNRAECISALQRIGELQQQRNAAYTEELGALGFSPPGESRYAYILSASPDWGRTAALGTHPDALSEGQIVRELGRPLAGDVVPGIDGSTFTAICIGNPDDDDRVDVWSVSSFDRKNPSGGTIYAWSVYNDWNDKEDKRGGYSYEK